METGRAPSIAFVGEGDNVRAGPTTPYNGQTWQCQTSWRRLCVARRRSSSSSVKGLMIVMTLPLYVALFMICLWCMTLAIDRHCSHVASYFQSNGSNHCNTYGMCYHLWNCAENHVDLCSWSHCCVSLGGVSFKNKLVTKTIMKNNPFKIKRVGLKWICLMLWRMTLTLQYQGHCTTMYPVINYIMLRTYNQEDMLIYSKISTLMSIILAINNYLESAASMSSLHLIVLLLRHMCGL